MTDTRAPSPTDDADMMAQAEGRLAYLVDQGSVKSAGVIRNLLAALRASQAERDEAHGELAIQKAAYDPDWKGHEKARGKLSLALERAEAAERERDEARIECTRRTPAEWLNVVCERDALREALGKYGRHAPECIAGGKPISEVKCVCGLDAALAPRPPVKEE